MEINIKPTQSDQEKIPWVLTYSLLKRDGNLENGIFDGSYFNVEHFIFWY